MKKKSVIIIVVMIALVVATVGYTFVYLIMRSQGGKQQQRSRADTVYPVRTARAAVSVLDDYVNVNGNIEALNSVSVYPNIGGKIASTAVNLGSSVAAGDVIARVDPSQPGTNYALSPVTAPISGSIISTPLRPGTTVTTGTAVTTIGDISRLQITAKVPERYSAYLKRGLVADIMLEAYPDVVFRATATNVSPVLDSTTRTTEVILTFDEFDTRVSAGMFAKVKLYTAQYTGAVTVPADAIVTNDDREFLYVFKDDDTVERREIARGHAVDGIVQIVSGVMPDELFVIEGGRQLFDGARVNAVSASGGE